VLSSGSILIVLLVLVVASTLLSPVFLTFGNVFNLLRQMSPVILITMGMLFVILTGNIDLSLGSVAALSGVMVAVAIDRWHIGQANAYVGLIVAALIGVATGAVSGLVSGTLVSRFKMMSFIATLAVGMIASGLAYQITQGHPIRIPEDSAAGLLLLDFGSLSVPALRIPWPVVVAIILIAVCAWVQKYTAFGRLCIATGSNRAAVLYAGQSPEKHELGSFVISGVMAAIGGIILTRAAVASPASGTGYELDAIAGCVIGGASLAGGKGSVLKALVGILIIGLIGNILDLLSVPAFPQKIIKGVIIIVAVLMQMATGRKKN
jgi:ribose transport system permease protein